MDPQKRTKLLAMILAGLVVVFGGYKYGRRWFYEPIVEKQQQIRQLDETIEKQQLQVIRIDDAKKRLADWKQHSLPPDDIDAWRLYKDWLTDLTEITGFQEPEVTPTKRDSRTLRSGRNRRKLFTALEVKVKGKTTFDGLCRFLYYFHRTNLVQRIVELTIESGGVEGNPPMDVTLRAEGLALADAKARKRLFPETTLKEAPAGDPLQAVVTSVEGFQPDAKHPERGTCVHMGRQLLTVTKMDGTQWTLRPGIDTPPNVETDAVPSVEAGSLVERIPLKDVGERTFAYYRRTVFGRGKNPFVLPVEYRPRLRGVRDSVLVRGDDLRMRAEAVDLDPDKGKPAFALSPAAPRGMTIDPKTGEIRWTPAKDDPAKTYWAEVIVRQGAAKEPVLREAFRVTLTNPNLPPVLTVSKTSHEVWVGSKVAFDASAKDPDGPSRDLRFSLARAPQGAVIDGRSGRFEWTPEEGTEPGRYDFDVVVSDSGLPARSDRRSVSILVKESAERYTKLFGILADAGEREAWLLDASTNQRIQLKEGRPFQAAGLSGFVYAIGRDFVEFQSDGKSYRLRLGKFLPQRERLVDPSPPATGRTARRPVAAPRPSRTLETASGAGR